MIGTRANLIRLAERRMRLVHHAHTEREALAKVIARSDEAALALERVRAFALKLQALVREQPWIAAVAVALLVALQPRRAFGWLMRGWGAWRMYRSALRWWQQFSGRSTSAAA
jgi:hypothetical protein